MNNDELIKGRLEDRIRRASDQFIPMNTGFLDPHERGIAESVIKSAIGADMKKFFSGGYEGAERTVLICMPPYMDEKGIAEYENEIFTVIRANTAEGGRQLRHGDYLGSLTGLGLDRSKIGDILVRTGGADIIVLTDVAEFIYSSYRKAAKSYLEIETLPPSELIVPEVQKETHKDTVASLRLDNMVACIFGLSRSKASEAIAKGIVFVNSVEQLKPDKMTEEGDKVVLHGKGKAIITSVGGRSRKDRIYIEYEKYI